jgi:hypothetical protein
MRAKVAQEIQWAVFASDAPLHSMKPEALPPTALFPTYESVLETEGGEFEKGRGP